MKTKQSWYGKEGYEDEKKHELFLMISDYICPFQKKDPFFETLCVLSPSTIKK